MFTADTVRASEASAVSHGVEHGGVREIVPAVFNPAVWLGRIDTRCVPGRNAYAVQPSSLPYTAGRTVPGVHGFLSKRRIVLWTSGAHSEGAAPRALVKLGTRGMFDLSVALRIYLSPSLHTRTYRNERPQRGIHSPDLRHPGRRGRSCLCARRLNPRDHRDRCRYLLFERRPLIVPSWHEWLDTARRRVLYRGGCSMLLR